MSRGSERREQDRAFEELVKRTSGRLRHIAFLFTGNWSDAEDMTQLAYLKAYRYRDRIAAVEQPNAYLKQILVRTCIDESRKRKLIEYVTDSVPDVGVVQDPNDEKWAVRAALGKVPKSQREILILRYYADMSVEETAGVLGCSTGNVKSQTSRGLSALERNLRSVPPSTEAPAP